MYTNNTDQRVAESLGRTSYGSLVGQKILGVLGRDQREEHGHTLGASAGGAKTLVSRVKVGNGSQIAMDFIICRIESTGIHGFYNFLLSQSGG